MSISGSNPIFFRCGRLHYRNDRAVQATGLEPAQARAEIADRQNRDILIRAVVEPESFVAEELGKRSRGAHAQYLATQ
jgi:hypothetical protein